MQRKIPMRMCVGCRQNRPKKEFVRVVRSPDKEITVDITGKKPGRGAYICLDRECLQKARKSRAIARMLETDIPDIIYNQLEEEIEFALEE